jgi:hypothetical protein
LVQEYFSLWDPTFTPKQQSSKAAKQQSCKAAKQQSCKAAKQQSSKAAKQQSSKTGKHMTAAQQLMQKYPEIKTEELFSVRETHDNSAAA